MTVHTTRGATRPTARTATRSTSRTTAETMPRVAPAGGAMPRPRRLTKAQLRTLERELRRERAQIERTLTSVGSAATPLLATPPEAAPLTAARQGGFGALPDTDGGLPVLLKSRTLGRLETLVAALRRLEAGAYGLCLGCDQPISFDRLHVMPEATHCMTCRNRS